MTDIALFHSVLGVRQGVLDARDRLQAAGHTVTIVDQYDGKVFDDYEEAGRFSEAIGFPALMQLAVDKVAELPDGMVTCGFSNGAGMAQYVATKRQVSKCLLFAGILPLEYLGADAWPAATAVQMHASEEDPWDSRETLEGFADGLRTGGATIETFYYPGKGHLFTDPTLPEEYSAEAAELAWERGLRFLSS